MHVTAIDIDKVSSFWSEFGDAAFGWTSPVLLFLCWLRQSFSSGCELVFLSFPHQISFRIKEVLKGATQSSRGWDISVCRVIPPPCKFPASPVGGGKAAMDDRYHRAGCLLCGPEEWGWTRHSLLIFSRELGSLKSHLKSLRMSMKLEDKQAKCYICCKVYIYFGKRVFSQHFPPKNVWAVVVSRLIKMGRQLRHIWADSFHLAWGSVVLTVWRLKHPLSFPASVVAFPPKKEWRYELYFPPPSELIIESQPFSGLHVSWWSQEQATKEAESEGCRSAVCCICVSHCSNQTQKVKHG